MRKTKNKKSEIVEAINSLRKQQKKVTTPSIAKLMDLSQQWTSQLLKRYKLLELVDSYNGRNV